MHRRIVDEMTSEQQQLFEGTNHSRQEVEALISTYVERVLRKTRLLYHVVKERALFLISVMKSLVLDR